MFLTCRIDLNFIDHTLLLLSDVAAAACGKPVPAINHAGLQSQSPAPPVTALDYSFNFTLTSAMIPAALDAHPYVHHPHSTRLVSPGLHHLPLQLPLGARAVHLG